MGNSLESSNQEGSPHTSTVNHFLRIFTKDPYTHTKYVCEKKSSKTEVYSWGPWSSVQITNYLKSFLLIFNIPKGPLEKISRTCTWKSSSSTTSNSWEGTGSDRWFPSSGPKESTSRSLSPTRIKRIPINYSSERNRRTSHSFCTSPSKTVENFLNVQDRIVSLRLLQDITYSLTHYS